MKIPSSADPLSEKVVLNNTKNSDQVTITERVNLTKDQYEVLNIICNTYEESVSQYLQEALVGAMTSSTQPTSSKDELENLFKQRMSIVLLSLLHQKTS